MIPSTEKKRGGTRHLVMAHPDAGYTAEVGRHFRRRGWEVHAAASGPDARRLVGNLSPAAVVLATDLPEESGWLTAAKLHHERPGCRVVLVTEQPSPDSYLFSAFIGATALVRREDGIAALEDEVLGTALAAVR